MSHLLRVAAGNDSQMETLCAATGAPAAQLHEAAIFFVKQVFFSGEANHYRVLGVDADASMAQIKEHYRLLMRLFHPDRNSTEGSWEDIYATRVNQSYNILRNSESRQQYDAALKITVQQKSIPVPVRQRHYYSSRFKKEKTYPAGIRLPLVVTHNLPQFVLGSVAVLAFLVIYLIYLPGAGDVAITQQKELADTNGNVGLDEETLAKEDDPHDFNPTDKLNSLDIAAQQPVISANKSLATELAVMPTLPVALYPPAAPQKQVAGQYISSANTIVTALDTRKTQKVAVIAPTYIPPVAASPPAAAKLITEAPSAVVSILAKVEAAPAVPASIPPAISDHEIESLLGRFVTSYERGDLESYVALFDDRARTSDKEGKVAIRKDYANLFSSSQNRQISLKNIRWASEGDSARGEGGFALRIRTRDNPEVKTYSGTVRFELVKLENQLLIKGFFHDLDSPK
jgi:DnaJ-domain-containing protein 1